MDNPFNRAAEDLGNIVALEHVNTAIPDQRLGTIFYIMGMGFTRDPYMSTGIRNMWINLGRSQFHLPTGEPQVLRGHVGIVVPDLEALLGRLRQIKGELDGTAFSVIEQDGYVDAISPWGNQLRCFEPDPRFGHINLGMPYIEFDVGPGTGERIGRFYREIFGSSVEIVSTETGKTAHCSVGNHQELIFRETDEPLRAYDDHHVQIYLANFSAPHAALRERELVSEESSQWQYRFKDISDLDSGVTLYTLEHEVRSMTHPLYGRTLVNRNADVVMGNFAQGHEELAWVTVDSAN